MFFRLLFNQARHRWQTTLLVFLTLTALVTLYVYVRNTSEFANRSMQLVMKNMGHNLLILPKDANPLDTYRCTDAQALFPEQVSRDLAAHGPLPTRYYVSVLQTACALDGHPCLLTGIEPVARGDETSEKGNLVTALKPGTARLGTEIATAAGVAPGDTVSLRGGAFEVTEVLPSKGTDADHRVYVPLKECQDLLGAPGQINVVMSFMCLHGGSMAAVTKKARGMLAELAPDYQLVVKSDMAQARYLARLTTSRSMYYILALVFGITVLVIVIAGLHEVAERKREAGILVAMGTGYHFIVGLYLAKVCAVAVFAACAGYWVGSHLAVAFTSPFMVVNTRAVSVVWDHLPSTLGLTVAVALLSEAVPVLKLIMTDPNATLTEE
ncbi:MAG: ABC transporter permease [bacterium]|nr:ABC transporter permease [bacterium]